MAVRKIDYGFDAGFLLGILDNATGDDRAFVISVVRTFRKYGRLSPAQKAAVHRIAEKLGIKTP